MPTSLYSSQGKLKSERQEPIFLKELKKANEDTKLKQGAGHSSSNTGSRDTGPEASNGSKDTKESEEFRRLSVLNAIQNPDDPTVSSVAWLPTSTGIPVPFYLEKPL